MNKFISILIMFIFVILSCSQKGQYAQEIPSDIDLSTIHEQAQNIQGLRSLLISENGQLTYEHYFKSYHRDSLDHLRSVTKSVMSMLIGIAIDQGMISGEDESLVKYLGDVKGFEKRHEQITIKHLLAMNSGIQWDESKVSEFNQWVVASDPIAYVLNRDNPDSPGNKFSYNSGGSHLLSVILTEASGMSTKDFANEYLFHPMGIKSVHWQRLGKYYNGAAGLEMKPHDMLLLGDLMVNEGKFNDHQLISSEWIKKSTSQITQIGESTSGYGYSWWTEYVEPDKVAMAMGYGGQFIIPLLDLNTTVVATCNWQGIGGSKVANQQERAILDMMKNYIYPYLKNKE